VGDEESIDKALAERQTVCVLITLEERVMMCQTADSDVAHIKRMAEESPDEGIASLDEGLYLVGLTYFVPYY